MSEAIDQPALRRHHLGLVLRTVRDEPRPRARIAEVAGLNRTTVSSLVAELAERGLVREGRLERGHLGRPGLNVELDGRRVCGIGAEINVNHVATVALDLRGDVVSQHKLSVDTGTQGPGEVFDRLALLIQQTLRDVADRDAAPVGLTLGLAGLVDVKAGVLTIGPNLGWRDVAAARLLGERLGGPSYPVLVDNEANLAALAEASCAPKGERENILVLVGEVGVGGGVVSRGALLRGSQGFAGEFGHMTVDPQGRRCGCGRIGCWETVIGLRALVLAATDPDDPLRDPALGLEERLGELNRRAELQDARTLAAMNQVGRWIGLGAAVLVNALNPEVIVLSGYFSVVGRWMVEALETALHEGSIAPRAGGCTVELSSLGFSAAVRGAAQVALDAVFADPTAIDRRPHDAAVQNGTAVRIDAPTQPVGGAR